MHRPLKKLEAAPWRYDFFSAVRLLETVNPAAPRIGTAQRAKDDVVRLSQAVSLAFEPAMVRRLCRRPGRPPQLEVSFFGLTGANGPMPLHFSEDVLSRQVNHGDFALTHFLDAFHHRLLSLLYRAWAQARSIVSADRTQQDWFRGYVAALSGDVTGWTCALDERPRYAGLFVDQRRSAHGLVALLRDHFGVPVGIRPFAGRWVPLATRDRLRLGPAVGQPLGIDSVLGRRVWNTQHSFRLCLGPMPWTNYRRLLPGGDAVGRLTRLVRRYVGEMFQWQVELLLDDESCPRLQLGSDVALGRSTWLRSSVGAKRKGRFLLVSDIQERHEAVEYD